MGECKTLNGCTPLKLTEGIDLDGEPNHSGPIFAEHGPNNHSPKFIDPESSIQSNPPRETSNQTNTPSEPTLALPQPVDQLDPFLSQPAHSPVVQSSPSPLPIVERSPLSFAFPSSSFTHHSMNQIDPTHPPISLIVELPPLSNYRPLVSDLQATDHHPSLTGVNSSTDGSPNEQSQSLKLEVENTESIWA